VIKAVIVKKRFQSNISVKIYKYYDRRRTEFNTVPAKRLHKKITSDIFVDFCRSGIDDFRA